MKDRKELNISHTDNEIAAMSQDMFRNLVKKSIERKALTHLNSLAMGHSKSVDLVKNRFERESYFEDNNFSKSEIELLFALRTRTIRNIKKNNFASQFSNNIACQLCFLHEDSQEHLLQCSELVTRVKIPTDINYSDIFKGSEKQLKIVRIIKQLLRTREILLQ